MRIFALRLRLPSLAASAGGAARRGPAPIVPTASLAGHALVMVIAIMTFLASLMVGAVDVVRTAADGWEAQTARELTIQVRPLPGRDIEQAVRRATEIARAAAGVEEVRVLSPAEMQRLLEPWLGTGLSLDELPTPRLIAVRLAAGSHGDIPALSDALGREIAGASLDDHRAWQERLRAFSSTLVGVCIAMFVLVLAATALSVLFATRGAMAGNRDIVDVLHVVGARDGFVARAFARRFLILGLKGGAIGGVSAMLVFFAGAWISGGGRPEVQALFGTLSVGRSGYLGVLGVILLVAALTAITSRMTVLARLRRLD